MGLLDPATGRVTGNLLNIAGATSGVFQAGAAVGVIVTAIVLDRLGRKNSVYVNAVIGLFGGALIVGAQNISMFLRYFSLTAKLSTTDFDTVGVSSLDGAASASWY